MLRLQSDDPSVDQLLHCVLLTLYQRAMWRWARDSEAIVSWRDLITDDVSTAIVYQFYDDGDS